MKHQLVFYLVTASVLASQASAGTMGIAQRPCTWVGSVSVGPVWARGGETQTFFLTSEIEKTYAARKSNNALASGELFLGMQKLLSPQWFGQLGLVGAINGNAKLQGVIWDDADVQFNNHSYQYKVQNTRLAVKGKLLYDKGYWAMPWLNASLGVGFF